MSVQRNEMRLPDDYSALRNSDSAAEGAAGIRRPVDIDGRPLVEGEVAVTSRQVSKSDIDRMSGRRYSGVRPYLRATREHDGVVVAVGCATAAVVTVSASGCRRQVQQRVPVWKNVNSSSSCPGLTC